MQFFICPSNYIPTNISINHDTIFLSIHQQVKCSQISLSSINQLNRYQRLNLPQFPIKPMNKNIFQKQFNQRSNINCDMIIKLQSNQYFVHKFLIDKYCNPTNLKGRKILKQNGQREKIFIQLKMNEKQSQKKDKKNGKNNIKFNIDLDLLFQKIIFALYGYQIQVKRSELHIVYQLCKILGFDIIINQIQKDMIDNFQEYQIFPLLILSTNSQNNTKFLKEQRKMQKVKQMCYQQLQFQQFQQLRYNKSGLLLCDQRLFKQIISKHNSNKVYHNEKYGLNWNQIFELLNEYCQVHGIKNQKKSQFIKQLGFMNYQLEKQNYDSNYLYSRHVKNPVVIKNPTIIKYSNNQNLNSCKLPITPDRRTKSSYQLLSRVNNQSNIYQIKISSVPQQNFRDQKQISKNIYFEQQKNKITNVHYHYHYDYNTKFSGSLITPFTPTNNSHKSNFFQSSFSKSNFKNSNVQTHSHFPANYKIESLRIQNDQQQKSQYSGSKKSTPMSKTKQTRRKQSFGSIQSIISDQQTVNIIYDIKQLQNNIQQQNKSMKSRLQNIAKVMKQEQIKQKKTNYQLKRFQSFLLEIEANFKDQTLQINQIQKTVIKLQQKEKKYQKKQAKRKFNQIFHTSIEIQLAVSQQFKTKQIYQIKI